MKQKRLFLSMLFIFVLSSMLSFAVLAAEEKPFKDVISEILDPIAGRGFDFAVLYGEYGMFIDLVIYLILFIGIAQATLMKHFEGTGGKTVVVVVGIMLAVGLAVWAHQEVDGKPRFMISDLGPLAGAIFALIIFVTAYRFSKGIMGEHFGDKATALFVAWIFIWYVMQAIIPDVFEWLFTIPIIGPLISLFTHIAIIAAIVMVINKFRKKIHLTGGSGSELGTGFEQTEKAVSKAEEIIEKGEEEEKKVEKTEDKENKVVKEMDQTLRKFQQSLGKLKKSEDVKEETKNIGKELKELSDELKQLKKLEDIEVKEETILQKLGRHGKTSNDKIVQLLQKEKSFLNAFESLVRRAVYVYNRPAEGGIEMALECITKARRILYEITNINNLEKI